MKTHELMRDLRKAIKHAEESTIGEQKRHLKPRAIAREYKKLITSLQEEQEKAYETALRLLKASDTSIAFDYFFNQPNGGNSQFEEELR